MAKQVTLGIEVPTKEISAIVKACHVLGDVELPYLRPTFTSLLGRLAGDIQGRAPRSFSVQQKGVSVTAGNIMAKGAVNHPGARSREFGRNLYWTGYTGRNQKSGHKEKRTGQRAQPFVGVKPGTPGAMPALAPMAKMEIFAAMAKEWGRIGSPA